MLMRSTIRTTHHSFGLPKMVILEAASELIQRTYLNRYFFHSGNQTVVETLLRNGADVNSKDNNNNTPLILASGNGNFIKLKIVK